MTERLRRVTRWLAKKGRLGYAVERQGVNTPCARCARDESSVRGAIGIDFAPFSSTLTDQPRGGNARGSVALDSLHGRVGNGASGAAIQYLGAAAAGHGG